MEGVFIVILITVLALAVIPLTIGYYLWLSRTVVPKVIVLPPLIARTVLAMCIAFPWFAMALVVWWLQR